VVRPTGAPLAATGISCAGEGGMQVRKAISPEKMAQELRCNIR
jgi:hypothetical protein